MTRKSEDEQSINGGQENVNKYNRSGQANSRFRIEQPLTTLNKSKRAKREDSGTRAKASQWSSLKHEILNGAQCDEEKEAYLNKLLLITSA